MISLHLLLITFLKIRLVDQCWVFVSFQIVGSACILCIFLPSNHGFTVSIMPINFFFCQKFFAEYSVVICSKLIFSWNTEKITLWKSYLYPSATMMWIVSGWSPNLVLFPCCRSNGHVSQQHNESSFLELFWSLHSISFNFQLPPLV